MILYHAYLKISSWQLIGYNLLLHTTLSLVLLKTCLGGPKLQFVLRASPCCDHPLLRQFDDLLHLALKNSCIIAITDDQWTQARLPVWSAGLGVRSVSMLVSSAFLASAAGTLPLLRTHILWNTQTTVEDTRSSLKHWLSIFTACI